MKKARSMLNKLSQVAFIKFQETIKSQFQKNKKISV